MIAHIKTNFLIEVNYLCARSVILYLFVIVYMCVNSVIVFLESVKMQRVVRERDFRVESGHRKYLYLSITFTGLAVLL